MPSESLERTRRYRERQKAERDRRVDHIIDGVEVSVEMQRKAGRMYVNLAMTMDTARKLEIVASEKTGIAAHPGAGALAAFLQKSVDNLRLEYARWEEPKLREIPQSHPRLQADILSMVEHGYTTAADITERLAEGADIIKRLGENAYDTPTQQVVSRCLTSLVKDKRLVREGKGRATRYYPPGFSEVQIYSVSQQMEADIDDLHLELKEVEHGYDTAVDILAQLAHWDAPFWWAKSVVYNALGKTDRPGRVLYDVPLPDGTKIDFTVLIPGEPRVVLEVQGGLYERRDGHWYRVGPTGEQEVQDPTIAASNNARTLHKYLKSKSPDNRGPYVVSVLLFPDMPAGHALEDFVDDSRERRVVVCGTEDLADRILERVHKVHTRIHSSSILSKADCEREAVLLRKESLL